MTIQLKLPNLDDNVAEYTVVKWLKQPGDSVEKDEPILEVETDKVTMEVAAESAGTLIELVAEPGTVLERGAVLATLRESQSDSKSNGRSSTSSEPQHPQKERRSQRLTPVVARLVSEHNINLSQVTGSGRQGRVTKKDILVYLKQHDEATVSSSSVQQSESGVLGELVQLTGMRRSIAEHMVRSVQTSPHVTTIFEFDFSAVAAHRAAHKADLAKEGVNLTTMAYVTYATANALKKFPPVNSVWHDDGIELKPEVNIGLIVSVENGLLAPVIREANRLSLRGLAKAIGALAERARSNQLKPSDMQGGTFSISNHGASGSLLGTPIIFQPQAGILGLGAIEERVKVVNGGIHIKPCAYVSFSFDHRIMDGALADNFVADIKRTIEHWGEEV